MLLVLFFHFFLIFISYFLFFFFFFFFFVFWKKKSFGYTNTHPITHGSIISTWKTASQASLFMVAPGWSTYVLLKKVDQISGSLNRHFEKGILCVLHIIMNKYYLYI